MLRCLDISVESPGATVVIVQVYVLMALAPRVRNYPSATTVALTLHTSAKGFNPRISYRYAAWLALSSRMKPRRSAAAVRWLSRVLPPLVRP
jgi:hypothetical protein